MQEEVKADKLSYMLTLEWLTEKHSISNVLL